MLHDNWNELDNRLGTSMTFFYETEANSKHEYYGIWFVTYVTILFIQILRYK